MALGRSVLRTPECCLPLTIYIARSFFDNVIGLDKVVQQRTKELGERNKAMRIVLDDIDQGLMTRG